MHDANGTPLKVGDRVLIEAEITSLGQSEEYCNVGIKTLLGRRPDGQKETMSAINAGVLVKLPALIVGLLLLLPALAFGQQDFLERVKQVEAAAARKAERAAPAKKQDVAPQPHRCVCGCEATGQCKCPNCSVGCGFVVADPKRPAPPRATCDCLDPQTCDCPEGSCICTNCLAWCRAEDGQLYLIRREKVVGVWVTNGGAPTYYPVVNGEWGDATAPPIKPPEPVRISFDATARLCRT